MLAVQVQYWTLQESKRHNLVTEDIAKGELAEKTRHNLQQEQYWQQSVDETIRHNLATEQETQRHNIVSEDVSYISAGASVLNAQASMSHAEAAMVGNAIRASELNLAADKFRWQQKIDLANVVLSTFDSAVRGASAITRAAGGV